MSAVDLHDELRRQIRHTPPKVLGERIRQARLDLDLTHDAAGERLGMTRQQLIKLENATNTPRPGTLIRIADGYGKPVAEFVDGSDAPFQQGRD